MAQLKRFSSARLPTHYGEFVAHTYYYSDSSADFDSEAAKSTDPSDNLKFQGHLVCTMGEDALEASPPLLRIHSECLTGDVLNSLRCDCGPQLHLALQTIGEAGCGILIYLRGQEGRGIGIGHKLRAYELQDEGYDTVEANLLQGLEADTRSYKAASAILKDLNVLQVRLMTNNPAKLELENLGIEIVERVPLESFPTNENRKYLETKRDRLGHLLSNLE